MDVKHPLGSLKLESSALASKESEERISRKNETPDAAKKSSVWGRQTWKPVLKNMNLNKNDRNNLDSHRPEVPKVTIKHKQAKREVKECHAQTNDLEFDYIIVDSDSEIQNLRDNLL